MARLFCSLVREGFDDSDVGQEVFGEVVAVAEEGGRVPYDGDCAGVVLRDE